MKIYYFKCLRCNYVAKQKIDIKRHLDRKKKCCLIKTIYNINKSDEELYNESLCPYEINNDELNKKFICQICNKEFTTKSNLIKHNKISKSCKNLGEKKNTIYGNYISSDFKFEICNQAFSISNKKIKNKIIKFEILKNELLNNPNKKLEFKEKFNDEKFQKNLLEITINKDNEIKENNFKIIKNKILEKIKIFDKNKLKKNNNISLETKKIFIENHKKNINLYNYNNESDLNQNYKITEEKIVLDLKIKEQEVNSCLILNNVEINYRNKDNYINAIQLCNAGNLNFNDWINSHYINELIIELEKELNISRLDLFDINKFNLKTLERESWIHPNLAIQLAHWISPIFGFHVSKWIRSLVKDENISIDLKLLQNKEKELELRDKKLKLLESKYLKKQKREEIPENNVIYMLTTKDNKKNGIYIIGKTINLKNRLSTYNKTAEHEVVYYKDCKTEENMNLIEMNLLYKLKKYKEKANRDRFILPPEKDISFFIDIMNESVKYIDNNELIDNKNKSVEKFIEKLDEKKDDLIIGSDIKVV